MKLLPKFSSESVRRYSYNTGWLLTDKIIRLGLTLLLSIVVARTLGPAQFGMLQYAISFAALFSMMATLGIEPVVVQNIVREPNRAGTLLGTVIVMRIIMAFIVFFLMLVLAHFSNQKTAVLILIAIVGAGFLFHPAQIIEQYFHARVRGAASSSILMLAAVLSALWVIFCATKGLPIIWFAAQPVIESGLIAVGFFWLLKYHASEHVSLEFDPELARSLIRNCWPLAISLALIGVYSNIDRLLINALLGNTETGIYVAATKLSEAWSLIPMVIVSSLFPAIVRAKERSLDHYQQRLQDLYNLMVWIGVAVATLVSLCADRIIFILYGQAYNEGSGILQLHVWSGVLVFLGIASGRWYILEGYTRLYLGRTVAGVIALVTCNLLLIPRLGMIGGAWSALISQLIVVLVFDAAWKESRGTFFMKCRALSPFHWFSQ